MRENELERSPLQEGAVAGDTTQGLHRCRLVARALALVYSWWTLFVRMVEPDRHMEAITSRPLLLHALALKTRHAGQTRLRLSSTHANTPWAGAAKAPAKAATFLNNLKAKAEQLSPPQIWSLILSYALRKDLKGQNLHPPPRLSDA